jgi:single-strand selective monofunctional uracil DNA glycosylase
VNLLAISDALSRKVDGLRFAPPVSHVYNPLLYARAPHARYLELYGAAPKDVLFLGMNPGPFGMAQTGVPFGDVRMVRDWLRIDAPVVHPPVEHPKRPIDGFRCARGEVSGARLWGWARDRFITPERFFARFFVANYCPLCFMEPSGRNLTPDKLPVRERGPLFTACDHALRQLVEALRPRYVFGVGGFAETRARGALDGLDLIIGRIPHPSPASPAANRGWTRLIDDVLKTYEIAI